MLCGRMKLISAWYREGTFSATCDENELSLETVSHAWMF